MLEVVTHAVTGVGVEAAHAVDLVAEALFGEDLGDAVLGHPGLVAVPQPMRGQARLDGKPAGEGCVVVDGLDAPAARRCVVSGRACGWPGGDGDAGPGGGVGDDELAGLAAGCFVASVAGGAEDAAGVVAAPVVAAVRAEEEVPAAAAVLGGAAAGWMRAVLDLAGGQASEERRQVDRETRLPGGAAVGVVFGWEPVEPAVEFAELPFDVDLVVVDVVAFQADRLAPAQAFSMGSNSVA